MSFLKFCLNHLNYNYLLELKNFLYLSRIYVASAAELQHQQIVLCLIIALIQLFFLTFG